MILIVADSRRRCRRCLFVLAFVWQCFMGRRRRRRCLFVLASLPHILNITVGVVPLVVWPTPSYWSGLSGIRRALHVHVCMASLFPLGVGFTRTYIFSLADSIQLQLQLNPLQLNSTQLTPTQLNPPHSNSTHSNSTQLQLQLTSTQLQINPLASAWRCPGFPPA